MKTVHFLYMPLTGLGLYGGYRGARWLKNRLKIFWQFVYPSLLAQTNKNFVLWVSVRPEDRHNSIIKQFKTDLEWYGSKITGAHSSAMFYPPEAPIQTVFTYSGVCFWDDKYPDDVAHDRLATAIHQSLGQGLYDFIGEADEVLMTIQPSDDCYWNGMVEETQKFFAENPSVHVFGYKHGFVMDYINLKLADWNPTTTPPFFTIRFPKETFGNPLLHLKWTGPYKSHEYVKDFLPAKYLEDKRSFLVGTHGENISTIFNHPFAGLQYRESDMRTVLEDFGLANSTPLKLPFSIGRMILRKLPHKVLRKLRFLAGEKKWIGRPLFAFIYYLLRL